MIHIIRKFKQSPNHKALRFNVSDAKKYLYELGYKDFRTAKFYILGADDNNELEELFEYFNQGYIIEDLLDGISVHSINENVMKNNRLIRKGVSMTALKNFKFKIENAIPLSEVTITLEKDTFTLILTSPMGDMKLICDYDLSILHSYAMNMNGDYIDLKKNDEMIKIINKIFHKQRYYYKNKAVK